MLKERIALIDGVRTPFVKAGTKFKGVSADDMGAYIFRELMQRVDVPYDQVDELILGNVAQPSNAANIARVVALKAGFPDSTPAYTVHRNCASGMEAVSTGIDKILAGKAQIIAAGGTESMSNIPLLFNQKMTDFFDRLSRARTLGQRLSVLASFRLSFLKPRIGVMEGLTDPVCGLIMGLTAENIAKDFKITREEQDQFALESHLKAYDAIASGRLAEEIVPFPLSPKYDTVIEQDFGMRQGQTVEALAKLKPYFDRKNGTVTVGNACPLTDGAAATLIMTESKAKELGLKPLGYIVDYAYAGLDPSRMGLGPTYATAKVFQSTGLTLNDIDLIEINEAFAAQVIGVMRSFEDEAYCQKHLGRSALGTIDPEKLNVNGGAIALGHPVGTTGTRLLITLLKSLKRRHLKRGLATLCIGGGQGGSFIVEAA